MASQATVQEQLAFESQFWVTEEKIVRLVECIVEAVHPLRIVAFGSRARGTHREESDLDLAVIVHEARRNGKAVYRARTLARVAMSVDLLVIDIERFNLMKDAISAVESRIDKEGMILYDSVTAAVDYRVARRLA